MKLGVGAALVEADETRALFPCEIATAIGPLGGPVVILSTDGDLPLPSGASRVRFRLVFHLSLPSESNPEYAGEGDVIRRDAKVVEVAVRSAIERTAPPLLAYSHGGCRAQRWIEPLLAAIPDPHVYAAPVPQPVVSAPPSRRVLITPEALRGATLDTRCHLASQ